MLPSHVDGRFPIIGIVKYFELRGNIQSLSPNHAHMEEAYDKKEAGQPIVMKLGPDRIQSRGHVKTRTMIGCKSCEQSNSCVCKIQGRGSHAKR